MKTLKSENKMISEDKIKMKITSKDKVKKKEEKTEKKTKKETKVSKKKIETVKKLVGLIQKNNTLIVASIKNLPSKQFQDIRKKLRNKAEIMVVKKRIMLKAIEESKTENIENLKKYIQEDSAILFSELDAFEIAGILAENKNPIGAKPGQTAEEEIIIEEGPTDLIPGPVISELGSLGIKIAVENGKIAIKERKVIAKSGEKIKEAAAVLMSKLDIKPFEIGLEPLAIYDSKTGKIYTDVKIDRKKTITEIKTSGAKAIAFAQKITYYCKETIGFLLRKANAQAGGLGKLQPKEEKKGTEEKPAEEIKDKENKAEEKPAEEKIKEENKPKEKNE